MINLIKRYTDLQKEELEAKMTERFGTLSQLRAHEKTSEYVCTDVLLFEGTDGGISFLTQGMGARKTSSPIGRTRCELMISMTDKSKAFSDYGMILANELGRISKLPFQSKDWSGALEIIRASGDFTRAFGYEAFILCDLQYPISVTDIKEPIHICTLVPIYQEELIWCEKNHPMCLWARLNDKYEGRESAADLKRELLIPNDIEEYEKMAYNLMLYFDLDSDELDALTDYVEASDKDFSKMGLRRLRKLVDKEIKQKSQPMTA